MVLLSILFVPLAAGATLIGDSVDGSMASPSGQNVTTQFASPAVVGVGTEFTGVITDAFSQVWDIAVDIDASSFTVAFSERTRGGDGAIASFPDPVLDITLSDLDWIGMPGTIIQVTNSAYSCVSAGFSCDFDAGPRIAALGFTADSIDVEFSHLRDGDSYTFDIVVPEPSTFAMVSFGLAGIAALRRRSVR